MSSKYACEEFVVEYGLRVKVTAADIQRFEADFTAPPAAPSPSSTFAAPHESVLAHCIICAALVMGDNIGGGDYVTETVCSIAHGDKFSRPRVICYECSEVQAWKHGKERSPTKNVFPVMKVFSSLKAIQGTSSTKSLVVAPAECKGNALNAPGEVLSLSATRPLLDSSWSSSSSKRHTKQNERRSYKDSLSSAPLSSSSSSRTSDIPFLETLRVVSNSAAYKAGLTPGDLFVKFGPFTHYNFCGLEELKSFVHRNGTQKIECLIGRRLTGERMRVKKHISIEPMTWDHGVVLGCVLNTYPAPVADK
eukprot:TRINITY_DN5890_c0_g1_i1.p1 TRINITY_DN5890_c0_g1~~TRINITY_DN5890_c0_g1_i1.p1  ORF type:complete len:307 (+),score=90.91 TRINITY_DN5890_c0_g1_i1:213-1133(+)